MVPLERESLNSLIEALQEWEMLLALTDLKDQECEDDQLAS